MQIDFSGLVNRYSLSNFYSQNCSLQLRKCILTHPQVHSTTFWSPCPIKASVPQQMGSNGNNGWLLQQSSPPTSPGLLVSFPSYDSTTAAKCFACPTIKPYFVESPQFLEEDFFCVWKFQKWEGIMLVMIYRHDGNAPRQYW